MNVIFPEEQIKQRVSEMGAQISGQYGTEEVHAFGIMDDSFVFLADLVRTLTCPVVCHFVKLETRDTVVGTQAVRNIVYGPISDIAGKNVLLVDALIDSGITLDHLVQQMLLKKPKSVRTAVLVDRENRRKLPFQVDYAGFAWAGNHLIGYGMDQGGQYRNLPYVAEIRPEEASSAKGGAVRQ